MSFINLRKKIIKLVTMNLMNNIEFYRKII